jgi:hypothetical protein
MSKMLPALMTVVLLVAVVLGGGCGYRRPARVPVEGTVTFDGEPLEGASVMLFPEAGGRPANAVTDAAGTFTLSTYGGKDGAKPGRYKVVVTKTELTKAAAKRAEKMAAAAENAAADGGTTETAMALSDRDYRQVVPERYANPDTSGLTVEITAGMEGFTLELSSER